MPLQDRVIETSLAFASPSLLQKSNPNDHSSSSTTSPSSSSSSRHVPTKQDLNFARSVGALAQITLLSMHAHDIFSRLSSELNQVTERIGKVSGRFEKLELSNSSLSPDKLENNHDVENENMLGNGVDYEVMQELLLCPETIPKSLLKRYNNIKQNSPNFQIFDDVDVKLVKSNEIESNSPSSPSSPSFKSIPYLADVSSQSNSRLIMKNFSDPSLFFRNWLKEQEKRYQHIREEKEKIRLEKKHRKESKAAAGVLRSASLGQVKQLKPVVWKDRFEYFSQPSTTQNNLSSNNKISQIPEGNERDSEDNARKTEIKEAAEVRKSSLQLDVPSTSVPNSEVGDKSDKQLIFSPISSPGFHVESVSIPDMYSDNSRNLLSPSRPTSERRPSQVRVSLVSVSTSLQATSSSPSKKRQQLTSSRGSVGSVASLGSVSPIRSVVPNQHLGLRSVTESLAGSENSDEEEEQRFDDSADLGVFKTLVEGSDEADDSDDEVDEDDGIEVVDEAVENSESVLTIKKLEDHNKLQEIKERKSSVEKNKLGQALVNDDDEDDNDDDIVVVEEEVEQNRKSDIQCSPKKNEKENNLEDDDDDDGIEVVDEDVEVSHALDADDVAVLNLISQAVEERQQPNSVSVSSNGTQEKKILLRPSLGGFETNDRASFSSQNLQNLLQLEKSEVSHKSDSSINEAEEAEKRLLEAQAQLQEITAQYEKLKLSVQQQSEAISNDSSIAPVARGPIRRHSAYDPGRPTLNLPQTQPPSFQAQPSERSTSIASSQDRLILMRKEFSKAESAKKLSSSPTRRVGESFSFDESQGKLSATLSASDLMKKIESSAKPAPLLTSLSLRTSKSTDQTSYTTQSRNSDINSSSGGSLNRSGSQTWGSASRLRLSGFADIGKATMSLVRSGSFSKGNSNEIRKSNADNSTRKETNQPQKKLFDQIIGGAGKTLRKTPSVNKKENEPNLSGFANSAAVSGILARRKFLQADPDSESDSDEDIW